MGLTAESRHSVVEIVGIIDGPIVAHGSRMRVTEPVTFRVHSGVNIFQGRRETMADEETTSGGAPEPEPEVHPSDAPPVGTIDKTPTILPDQEGDR